MTTLGGIEIAGGLLIASAVAVAGAIGLSILGDAVGREIERFFGFGGHWAHERRGADLSNDEGGSHAVTDAPETTGTNSGRIDIFAAPRLARLARDVAEGRR